MEYRGHLIEHDACEGRLERERAQSGHADSEAANSETASAVIASYNRNSPNGRVLPMAAEVIFLVEEAPEVDFTARALGYSIFTEADTWDELREARK